MFFQKQKKKEKGWEVALVAFITVGLWVALSTHFLLNSKKLLGMLCK
jgi:hypothetical protein